MRNRKKQRRMKKEGRRSPDYSQVRAEVLRKRREKHEKTKL